MGRPPKNKQVFDVKRWEEDIHNVPSLPYEMRKGSKHKLYLPFGKGTITLSKQEFEILQTLKGEKRGTPYSGTVPKRKTKA